MRTTKHAREQQQRRGIADGQLALVLSYGSETKATGHVRMLRVTRKDMAFMRNEWPEPIWRKYRDRINGTVTVVGGDERVITAMHRYRRLWRTE